MPPATEPGLLCRAAIQAAERSHGLPPALLPAIARVESGRRDPRTGAVHPWPWTVNAEGRGYFFDTKADAVAFVRAQQARGVRSLDVGCLQVNLLFHPTAFASLEEAFDPARNAAYAARFLTELYAKSGSWDQAGANYHSSTPHLAEAYQRRLQLAWAEERRAVAETAPGPQLPGAAMAGLVSPRFPGLPLVAAPGSGLRHLGAGGGLPLLAAAPGSGARLSNSAERALVFRALPLAGGAAVGSPGGGGWPGPGRGRAGRGLDAYRAAPIPMAYAAAPRASAGRP